MNVNKGIKTSIIFGCLTLMPISFMAQTTSVENTSFVFNTSPNGNQIVNEGPIIEDNNVTVSKTISNAKLFDKIPSNKSINGRDVCVYVSNEGSKEYRDSVNSERRKWNVSNVGYSQDLETGAMLRAGEEVVDHMTGQQKSKANNTSKEYYVGWENLVTHAGSAYDASYPFNSYFSEKKYVPEDFNAKTNNYAGRVGTNGQSIKNFSTMVYAKMKYVGQGVAYSDSNCDGTSEYTVYANEHAATNKDLYPKLSNEINKNLSENLTVNKPSNKEEVISEEKVPVKYSHEWVGTEEEHFDFL